jgi:hypothetical protein
MVAGETPRIEGFTSRDGNVEFAWTPNDSHDFTAGYGFDRFAGGIAGGLRIVLGAFRQAAVGLHPEHAVDQRAAGEGCARRRGQHYYQKNRPEMDRDAEC